MSQSDKETAKSLLKGGPYLLAFQHADWFKTVDEDAALDATVKELCKKEPAKCEETKRVFTEYRPIERYSITACVKRTDDTKGEWAQICLKVDIRDNAANRKWLRTVPAKRAPLRVFFDDPYVKDPKMAGEVEVRFLTNTDHR